MHIRWKKRRIPRAKSPMIYLSEKGPVVWDKPGDIRELDDKSGYAALEKDPDILEIVDPPSPPKPAAKKKKVVNRRARVPRDKRLKTYEDK